MVRRSFRIGLRLGILVGVVWAVTKMLQSRRAEAPAFEPTPWTPAPVPSAPAPPPAPAVAPEPAPAPKLSWVEPVGGVCPKSHPVKVKLASRIFHVPGLLAYDRTRPDRCYSDESSATRDGFTRAKR